MRDPAGFCLLLLVAVLLITQAEAQDSSPPPTIPGPVELQDGDTFVFLGDSITHQRLYTQYVETFVYTRYPARRIRFHNAGVGGAQAWDALQRMKQDVTSLRPKYVSILLGMNDGHYQPFDRTTFDTYRADMQAVIREIQQAGAATILMSPTMFDSRAASLQKRQRPPEFLEEYNSVLAYYGRWLEHQAFESGLAYVDMFGPLNRITLNRRKKDARFTMIRDAVHPDPPGQVVMALAMIEQLGLGRSLSSIVIRPGGRNGPNANVRGGQISKLKRNGDRLEFHWTADGLPWVLPESAQPGINLTRATQRVSRESLRVTGLKPGRYEVVIDGTVVATAGAEQLGQQLLLQSNNKTPQYQQAIQVAKLNAEKNEGPVGRLRGSWSLYQAWARVKRQANKQPDNAEMKKKLAELNAQMETHNDRVAAAQQEIAGFDDRIYEASQPKTQHYVIRKVTQ